jgi:Holliday junction resolvase RusA-like endonuclease
VGARNVRGQLSLPGLFDDVTEVPLDTVCCEGTTYHVPHCRAYVEAITLHDEQRAELLRKGPDLDTTPIQTIHRIRLEVRGNPAPQGSKDAYPIYEGTGQHRRFTGKVALVEVADAKVKAWRRAVAAAVGIRHRKAFPARAPLLVECLFSVTRPTTDPPNERTAPVVRPDVDKYLRGTLDALVIAGVMPDDGQVLRATGDKDYAGWGRGPTKPGAYITVSRILL